jgi:hypothetical protein
MIRQRPVSSKPVEQQNYADKVITKSDDNIQVTPKQKQNMTPIFKPKIKKVISPEIRFEFTIPSDVPPDKIDMYMWGKLKIICRNLSKNGLKVTPAVPTRYMDRA